jgi:hypothetical protein
VKTFPMWRAVGRAMLDARRREGVTAPRVALDEHRGRYYTALIWKLADERTVELWWRHSGRGRVDLAVKYPEKAPGESTPFTGMDNIESAATALRVLAALDLIPVDIAYAADERYGKCEVPGCRRIARWWRPEGGAAGRWVHHPPRPALPGRNTHQAVVAESNTEHKDNP